MVPFGHKNKQARGTDALPALLGRMFRLLYLNPGKASCSIMTNRLSFLAHCLLGLRSVAVLSLSAPVPAHSRDVRGMCPKAPR